MVIYYCPKCNSKDIKITCLNPPEPERISIDDISKERIKAVNPVYRMYQYQAKCKCGYIVEYTA